MKKVTPSQTHRSKPVNLARYHRDPTVQAIDARFGHRRNGLAAELARAVVRMFRRAKELHLDGYVEEAEALHLLGGSRKTQRRRLECLLELPKFFELRDGRLYLRKLWLSAEKRQADLAAWRRELDRDALKKRRKRGHDDPGAPVARRKEWLSDIAQCIPEELLTPPQNVSPPAPEVISSARSAPNKEKNFLRHIPSDPPSEPCVSAKMPAAKEKLPLTKATVPRVWSEVVALGDEAIRLFYAREHDEDWERARAKPSQVHELQREGDGSLTCLIRAGFVPAKVAYEKFTEAELLAGYRKAKKKYGPAPGGPAITHAARQIRAGLWAAPC